MSYEIIVAFVMIFSFLGMVFITIRKIPAITELPNNPNFIPGVNLKERFTREAKDVIKKKYFEIQIIGQKSLSRVRILILRLDNRIFNWNLKLKETTKKTKEDIDFELDDIKNKLKDK